MRTANRNRTEYSFSTPTALAHIEYLLTYLQANPGKAASVIGPACRMTHPTACTYLAHLAQTQRAHSLAPPKGKGLRWYAGPNVAAQPARKKIAGERIVNIVRASDCRMPKVSNDPLMSGLFGGRR
jgi:hypothetical protein